MLVVENGVPQDTAKIAQEWRERIDRGLDDRKRFERTWMSNIAFTAGKHWLKWNPGTNALELPLDMRDKDLYTADVITERRLTALGELSADDDRPELLLIDDGDEMTDSFQAQINRALGYGWDYEWRGDDALTEVRRLCLDLGVSAMRVRFDPTAGPPILGEDGEPIEAPYIDGKALLDPAEARTAVAEARQSGQRVEFRAMHEGRICWEPLSALNLIVPPGIPNENDFPWEIVVRPVPLSVVQAEYPAAKGLMEDTDISSMIGVDAIETTSGDGFSETRSKLRGHVWLFTGYERPCPDYPKGRTVVLGGNQRHLLDVKPELPCKMPDGTFSSGVSYFHWWRVTGRFWSRSFVEPLKDPQRLINRRKTQNMEIVDRGMPKVFVEEGSLQHNPEGLPLEKVEVAKGAARPDFFGGIGPGEWMYRDIEEARVDLDHASGIRGPSLGDNPENVGTYSQLALLSEKDQVKRAVVRREHASSIGRCVESTVHYMRTYWGPEKQVVLADDDDKLEAFNFNATKIPAFYVVKIAKGSPKPRSQAAELKKIEDLARYSVESQQPLPVDWYADSLEAGKPLEMPTPPGAPHIEKAELENHYLLSGEPSPSGGGDVPPVMEYDPPEIHIPTHREAQIQAEQMGDAEAWQRIQDHIDEHEQVAQAVMAQQAAMAPQPESNQPEQGQPKPQE